jgi:hypothetical protein
MVLKQFKKTKKWYERYLPFVARSIEGQVKWLVSVLNKGVLSLEELTPYINLLLAENSDQEEKILSRQLGELSNDVLSKLLSAADIYDTPKLFKLIPQPDECHAEIALRKDVPPYEKKPLMVLDEVYYAINNYSDKMLGRVAEKIIKEGNGPKNFKENYKRFRGILEDEEFLLSLYPYARG